MLFRLKKSSCNIKFLQETALDVELFFISIKEVPFFVFELGDGGIEICTLVTDPDKGEEYH